MRTEPIYAAGYRDGLAGTTSRRHHVLPSERSAWLDGLRDGVAESEQARQSIADGMARPPGGWRVRATAESVRGYYRPVDVQVNTALNDSEHDQLDAWIRTPRDDEIDYVTIESRSVAIHIKGPRRAVMSAIAVRHASLAAALDDALSTLHNTP